MKCKLKGGSDMNNKIINEYIERTTWRIKENANASYSMSGLKSYIASTILARHALEKLPAEIRKAHLEGAIHIHDLENPYSPYCYGADLQQLMMEGLKNPVGSNSVPAKHLDSMVDHMVNYLYISQNEFNGAQAFSNVDTLLAPFAMGEEYEFIKQCIQRLVYNISYPLRSSFQTPFINFSFDLIVPEHLENEPVIIGGKTRKLFTGDLIVYGDLQEEVDLINKAFLEVLLEGDSKGNPFTFPIPTYGITKEVLKKDDEVMDLLWKVTAKYGLPNFMNYISTGASPDEVRAMCCRLNLRIDELKARGLWNMGNKTGSLGVVTINLNYCGKDGESKFFDNVDEMYDLAVKQLLLKRENIYDSFRRGLLPFTACYLPQDDPFRTFFLTIGVVGMNEACLNMFGNSIEFCQDFVVKLLKHLNKRVKETSEETGILFNLEETPAEGCSYRLARLDKKRGLPTQGVDNPYLTNSTHCPVNTIFDWSAVIGIQEKFKKWYTGGTIMHCFVGDELNPEIVREYVKSMAEDSVIPYYNLTPTYSVCQTHGYIPGKVELCPKCHEPTYIYSRVVGYYRPIFKWNAGKQEEFKERKMYQNI